MYTGQLDIISFLLYIIMGFLGMFLLDAARKKNLTNSANNNLQSSPIYNNGYYVFFVLFFAAFAAFRKVDYKLGGADALNYVNRFLVSLQTTAADYERSGTSEPLFHLYVQIIRFFSQDYKVFFAISYGIIAYSYCKFHCYYLKKDNVSRIPFILIVFPYLKSFCTLRSSMAIAIFLLALTLIEKYKYVSLCLLISTMFIHRMSALFVLIWPFYFLYKKKLSKYNGRKAFLFVSIYVVLSMIASKIIQAIIVNKGWLESTDAWYVSQSTKVSILSRWPMFIAQLILLIMMWLYQDEIKKNQQYESIKIFCIFDFIMIPASLVLGLWRANEYLYLARLIMWANLLPVIEIGMISKQKSFIRFWELLLFTAWLGFRINSEWDDLKIMPYLLWWQ